MVITHATIFWANIRNNNVPFGYCRLNKVRLEEGFNYWLETGVYEFPI
jgi:hypothetical protein